MDEKTREEWFEEIRRDYLIAGGSSGWFLKCRKCESSYELPADLDAAHQMRRVLAHASQHKTGKRS